MGVVGGAVIRRCKGRRAFGACVAMQKLPTTVAPRSPRQCVSNSEAASGLLTGLQGTDALTNLPGTPYSVRLQPRRRMQGWVLRAGGPPPATRAASFFPDSFFAGEERIGPPEGASSFVW